MQQYHPDGFQLLSSEERSLLFEAVGTMKVISGSGFFT
jgi:hypothetical protein